MSSHEAQALVNPDGNSTTGLNACVNADDETHSRKCYGFYVRFCSRDFLKAFFLGQLLSVLLCGTGVFSELLSDQGVHTPTAQNFLNYILLCLVFMVILACRRDERTLGFIFRNYWWKYLLLAVVDVEANYVMVKAYKYTTMTSVQLLDCFSIATVVILSFLVLRTKYKLVHIVGVLLCLLGFGGLILADILAGRTNDSAEASNRVLGDVLCVVGASLYGVSNVGEEFVVKKFARSEFLGMVGLFGSFISGLQLVLLERSELVNLDFTSYKIVLPWIGFVTCQFLIYTCMTVVIQVTSSTAVNLSILSADFYALLFGLFLFKYQFHFLYFIAFTVIVIGIGVYMLKPTATRDRES